MRGGRLLVGRLECISKGQLCAAAHHPISWRLQWAHARDWARELAGCCGPARAHRQGQLIRIIGPCKGLGMRGGRLLVGQLECIGKGQLRAAAHHIVLTMGPCEGLGTRACRLLWPSLSSSARAAYSHYGPMQRLCSATVGPM
jgi:hypothetical protein